MNKFTCEVCGEGVLEPCKELRAIDYGGKSGYFPLSFSKCNVCNSEVVNNEQSLLNRREVNRFKKRVDGIPLGEDIKHMRLIANLTQAEAGALLGGGPVAFSKYEHDDLIPDSGMSTLLLLLIENPSLVEKIRALKSTQSKSSVKFIVGVDLQSGESSKERWQTSLEEDEFGLAQVIDIKYISEGQYSEVAGNLWSVH